MTTSAQPVPFPEDDANIIEKFADLTLYAPAREALELVRNMLGNPGNVQRAIRTWEDCIGNMSSSFNAISQTHSQVTTSWQGGAAANFETYARDVKKIITGNVNGLQNMAKATSDMYSAILDAYKEAVTFLSECAQNLINFSGAITDWKSIAGVAAAGPTGGVSMSLVMGHFVDLLERFVGDITDLYRATIDTVSAYASAVSEFMREVKDVSPPPGPVKGILELGAWSAK
ncbi:hypothetical protein GCM10010182_56720 [Actinomadura cremea]|nr:hypothetical protein GCM10010182_56720 [Actinomadura cremea]